MLVEVRKATRTARTQRTVIQTETQNITYCANYSCKSSIIIHSAFSWFSSVIEQCSHQRDNSLTYTQCNKGSGDSKLLRQQHLGLHFLQRPHAIPHAPAAGARYFGASAARPSTVLPAPAIGPFSPSPQQSSRLGRGCSLWASLGPPLSQPPGPSGVVAGEVMISSSLVPASVWLKTRQLGRVGLY